jgi:hypothetical protein
MRIKTLEEVKQYFSGLLAFIDSTEQQIIKESRCSIQAKIKNILLKIKLL